MLAGVAAMAAGATLLVEAVQRITQVESTQTGEEWVLGKWLSAEPQWCLRAYANVR